jgi:hypothetical protein
MVVKASGCSGGVARIDIPRSMEGSIVMSGGRGEGEGEGEACCEVRLSSRLARGWEEGERPSEGPEAMVE